MNPDSLINIQNNLVLTDSLIFELRAINQNLDKLAEVVAPNSFLDSQLFGALIGASAAIGVLLLQQTWGWLEKRNQRIDEIYDWVVKQHDFFAPKNLYKNAVNHTYGGTWSDGLTGRTRKIPNKPLGEKMVIELGRKTKHTTWPRCKLRRLLGRYEKSVVLFDDCDPKNRDELNHYLDIAEKAYEPIVNEVYKKKGVNEWTRY